MYLGFFLVSGMCQDLTESLTTSVIRQQFRNYTNLPEIFPWNFALKLSQRWVQHYRAHSKWSRGHCCKTETEEAEEVSPSPLSPSSAVSLSQRWVRLAKQIAATFSEITGEIAKGKKLRQTRVSVTSQDKYRLLLNSYTGKNLEWYRRPSPFSHRQKWWLWGREAAILPHELWIWAMVFGGHWSGTGYSLKIFAGMIFHLTLLFWHGCQHLIIPALCSQAVFTASAH